MKLRFALIVSALTLGLAAAAQAGPYHDGYRAGDPLQARIDHGVRTGRLSPYEARRLEMRRIALRRDEARYWRNDGHLDPRERARLHHRREELARDIHDRSRW